MFIQPNCLCGTRCKIKKCGFNIYYSCDNIIKYKKYFIKSCNFYLQSPVENFEEIENSSVIVISDFQKKCLLCTYSNNENLFNSNIYNSKLFHKECWELYNNFQNNKENFPEINPYNFDDILLNKINKEGENEITQEELNLIICRRKENYQNIIKPYQLLIDINENVILNKKEYDFVKSAISKKVLYLSEKQIKWLQQIKKKSLFNQK